VIIESAELWAAMTNCYVIASEEGGQAVIVDAPPDIEAISSLVKRHDFLPVALLVTHGHVDHAGGAGNVVERIGATAYIHPDDDFLSADPVSQLEALLGFVPPDREQFAPPEQYSDLAHGDRLPLAGMTFEVRHTPGHTPGHCVFVVEQEGLLFSGDQLFAGSIGRTDLPGGDFKALMQSMETEVLTLPDETRVLPGHGPETTVGRERRVNPFLRDFEV
jgi:glyoxylase-like metal-dependent hydrolase (beta-lactamase superfamily II)